MLLILYSYHNFCFRAYANNGSSFVGKLYFAFRALQNKLSYLRGILPLEKKTPINRLIDIKGILTVLFTKKDLEYEKNVLTRHQCTTL